VYLRITKRKNSKGEQVAYYQLAHNARHPETGQPVARILYNFGRADRVGRDQLVRLCRSIARVCNLRVIDPLEEGAGDHGQEERISAAGKR